MTKHLEFWAQASQKYLYWHAPWKTVLQGDFYSPPLEWFVDGLTNASYNCIDRHLAEHAHKTAILWVGNETHQSQKISYQELYEKTCQMANLLKHFGIQKGDVVCIYMPMIPEAIFAILACSRIGAIHNVIFGGFSADALENRICDSKAKLVITSNAAPRGTKIIPFKTQVDLALKNCPSVKKVLVIKHLEESCPMMEKRDHFYHEHIHQMAKDCPLTWMKSTEPLFILYTSGSTGKPKGIVHSTGGYLTYVASTYASLFGQDPNAIHWCTADIGWITGHSYLVYGTLLNAATTLIYEGVPNYPDYARYWQIIEKYQVQNFYTAPTLLRSLRHEGSEWITPYKLDSLKLLGSVGEPINPDVWQWYFDVIGKQKCPIINTWWQTETGGILMSASPHQKETLPGSVGKPMAGIEPYIDAEGMLYIQHPWPGMMSTIFNDFERFKTQYLGQPHLGYLTGDSAYQHEQGEYVINGRLDDVIKVSGHRLGSEELESTAVSHPDVNESAVIGVPHPIKGESIFIFAVTYPQTQVDAQLSESLKQHMRQKMGPVATPEQIFWVSDLPKTRSGKIMRRILRKIVLAEDENLGDLSTLANPEVVESIRHELQGAK